MYKNVTVYGMTFLVDVWLNDDWQVSSPAVLHIADICPQPHKNELAQTTVALFHFLKVEQKNGKLSLVFNILENSFMHELIHVSLLESKMHL